VSAFALGGLTTALVQRSDAWPRATARGRLDRDAFHAAVDTIVDRHVDPVDADAAYARALKHMVAGLDPYSHYLGRDERRRLGARARHGVSPGLALHFGRGDADERMRVEIAAVVPGSMAAARGLAPGDVVLAIRGRAVDDLQSPAEAEALLTGRVGESVELLVQRPKDARPAAVAVELERIRDRRIVTSRLHRTGAEDTGPVYGIIRIRAFESGAGGAVKRALSDLERAADGKLDGVVLDVRQNPGGAVDEALVVADLFIHEGVLTRTRGRGGTIKREERAHEAGTDRTTRLVVLQDRHSASASELLAVALQEHGRARVVGERSYGKGSVQEIIGLTDGSQLTLTTARYFSPRDRRIDGVGVAPDVHVVMGPRGEPGADLGLDEAIKVLGATH